MKKLEIKNFIGKYKIKPSKIYKITFLTALEIVMILWLNDWEFTPAIMAPFVQFIMVFESKDIWNRISSKEKDKLAKHDELIIQALEEIRRIANEKRKDTSS